MKLKWRRTPSDCMCAYTASGTRLLICVEGGFGFFGMIQVDLAANRFNEEAVEEFLFKARQKINSLMVEMDGIIL